MKVLAIESSAMVAGAAVVDENKLIGEFLLNHKKTHSQKLMPIVEEVLNNIEMSIKDIDIFAVSEGPGSFTGLRIGVSTVKALAQVTGKPVVGVPTLDGLAYNLAYSPGLICPIMDARREQVYTSIYKWQTCSFDDKGESQLKRLDEYMGIPVVDLMKKLKQMKETVVFNGDGVPVYKDVIIHEMGENARFAPPTDALQRASSIAWLALKKAQMGQVKNYIELEPFYLRKSQAEQNFQKYQL